MISTTTICTPARKVWKNPSTWELGESSNANRAVPSFNQLQTWVQRPISTAKCSIMDFYSLRALVPADADPMSYLARDVFLLDQWPCRSVEIVGWVAGVDMKESTMVVTLDDGNGDTVLPVTIRLPVRDLSSVLKGKRKQMGHSRDDGTPETGHFVSAKERKAQRRAAAAVQAFEEDEQERVKFRSSFKVYDRKDIRVGDTVRVVGRVDEWMRKKADGSSDWVRQLAVDEGFAGSINVVDSDQEVLHALEARRLRETVYNRPFEIPSTSTTTGLPPSSPFQSTLYSDSIEPSSDLSMPVDLEIEPKLRDPSKLHSSQLKDSVFRTYLLDHMIQELLRGIKEAEDDLPRQLTALFPEYGPSDRKGKGKAIEDFSISHPENVSSNIFRPRKGRKGLTCALSIVPFTIHSLLHVPHLHQLACLIVENESRREEKRRRKRLRDGQARPRDLEIEDARRAMGKEAKEWRLAEDERGYKIRKMVAWVIRQAAEDGHLVHAFESSLVNTEGIRLARGYGSSEPDEGYLPLPPDLVLPLLCRLIERDAEMRKSIFRSRTESRRGIGLTLVEMTKQLQSWGVDGRWERVKEWVVDDAVRLGVQRGVLTPEGKGWRLTDTEGQD